MRDNPLAIAVVGSGIAGLTAAYYLSQRHTVSVFEADSRLGGHTHTHYLTTPTGPLALDSGFIVCNDRTYPNFLQLMDKLQVRLQPSDMSFSYYDPAQDFGYNGSTLAGMFAQKKHLFSPRYYQFLRDILKFNRQAKAYGSQSGTLADFLAKHQWGDWFKTRYLGPMLAAIWSTDPQLVYTFPAQFLFQFMTNHGLLDITQRPQWYTIAQGSRGYIDKLTRQVQHIYLNTPVKQITRDNGIRLYSHDQQWEFDRVVVATHSDQALRLLAVPSTAEKQLLGAIEYRQNRTVLHKDTTFLPPNPALRASWNYHAGEQVTLTYYLNQLQRLQQPIDYCVTVNPQREISAHKIIASMDYAHPVFNQAAVAAAGQVASISGAQNTHYCGAYWGYGFHEDGVNSALRVVAEIEQAYV